MENSMKVYQNLKIELLYDIGFLTLWRKHENTKGKYTYILMFNYTNICNSQDIETTKAPVDEWTIEETLFISLFAAQNIIQP